jgi:hypothetical protein
VTQRVGQYELVRRIGSGGMAEVFMGRRASVGGAQKSVAIKLMAARVEADERHRRMFLAEARLSMLMTHSNVVQVFDAGEDAGRLYLVMEWIDGLNLAQLLELQRGAGRPLDPRLSAYVVGEVLRGLAYAHHLTHDGQLLCVVHRDVSPHNVLVSTSGEVKIADFGVARLTTEETSGIHIKGKLRYMAPEHLAGRSREPTVDLYGVGAVLHELLTGSRFRDEADEVDLYGQILGGHVPPLSVPGVPPELASLRDGLLQADPRQRIPTATRALEYLAAWAGYRNASVELGALCRGAMGVVAPRSGIESAPTLGPVDPQADTQSPSVATPTSDAVVTHTAGAAPASTRTSGAVSAAIVRRPSAQATVAGPPGRPVRRRALLVGASVLGAGFAIGGVAVAVLHNLPEDARPEPEPGSPPVPGAEVGAEPSHAAAEPSPAGQGGESSGAAATDSGTAAEAAEGPTDAVPAWADDGAGDTSAGDTGAATEAEAAGEPVAAGAAAAAGERRPKATGRATVELSVDRSLRVAYVRLAGATIVLEPRAERRVTAGRHAIWWRKTPEASWIDGGTFTFAAGRRYKVRVSSGGVTVE